MRWIKEATVATYPIGPFVNGSGIFQGSLNIVLGDTLLSKEGGAFGTMAALATVYPDKNGYYFLGLDATDTDTPGALRAAVTKSGKLPTWEDFMVLPADKYDFLTGVGGVPSVGNAGVVGSVAFVSGGVIGSVGNVVNVNSVAGGVIGSVGFLSSGVVGSVGNAEFANYVRGGIIGTTTFAAGGVIGSVGHVAAVASGAVGTPYIAGGVIGSVGFLSDGMVGTATFVRGGVIGSVGNVEGVTMGTVPHVMSVGSFGAAALAAIPTADAIADAILKRDIDNVEATAAVHSLTTAILKAVSRIKDNAGTLETYMTNGTTVKLSQTVTTDTSDEPIDELGVGT